MRIQGKGGSEGGDSATCPKPNGNRVKLFVGTIADDNGRKSNCSNKKPAEHFLAVEMVCAPILTSCRMHPIIFMGRQANAGIYASPSSSKGCVPTNLSNKGKTEAAICSGHEDPFSLQNVSFYSMLMQNVSFDSMLMTHTHTHTHLESRNVVDALDSHWTFRWDQLIDSRTIQIVRRFLQTLPQCRLVPFKTCNLWVRLKVLSRSRNADVNLAPYQHWCFGGSDCRCRDVGVESGPKQLGKYCIDG